MWRTLNWGKAMGHCSGSCVNLTHDNQSWTLPFLCQHCVSFSVYFITVEQSDPASLVYCNYLNRMIRFVYSIARMAVDHRNAVLICLFHYGWTEWSCQFSLFHCTFEQSDPFCLFHYTVKRWPVRSVCFITQFNRLNPLVYFITQFETEWTVLFISLHCWTEWTDLSISLHSWTE